MFEYKSILGGIAIFIAFIGYIPYFKDIFRGKTKPHAFTWLVWGISVGIAFVAQLLDKGGAGSWVTGFTALICFVVFFLALKKGEKNITTSDKWSLFAAAVALILWFITNSPLLSVILITIVDTCGFYPTFRKSYYKPHEETITTHFLNGLKFVLALFALEKYSLITVLFPMSLVITNFAFVALLVIRRAQVKQFNK